MQRKRDGYKNIPSLHSPYLLDPQEELESSAVGCTPQSQKKGRWAEGGTARVISLQPCRPSCSHGSGGELLRVWLSPEAMHPVPRAPTDGHGAPRSPSGLLPKCTLNFPLLFIATAPVLVLTMVTSPWTVH